MTALLMFGGFALLLILGVPIALSLGVSTMAAIAGSPDITVSINTVAQRIFGGLDSTSIMAIAFFVLSGNVARKDKECDGHDGGGVQTAENTLGDGVDGNGDIRASGNGGHRGHAERQRDGDAEDQKQRKAAEHQ